MSDNKKRVGQKKMNRFEKRLKDGLKDLRIDHGHQMNKGAQILGISRKQLEDVETHRNYGCHIDSRLLCSYMKAYSPKAISQILEAAHHG